MTDEAIDHRQWLRKKSHWLLLVIAASTSLFAYGNTRDSASHSMTQKDAVAIVGLPTYDAVTIDRLKASTLSGGNDSPAPLYGIWNDTLAAIYWGMLTVENDLVRAAINEESNTNIHTLGLALSSFFDRESVSGTLLNIGQVRGKFLYQKIVLLNAGLTVDSAYLGRLETLNDWERDWSLEWSAAIEAHDLTIRRYRMEIEQCWQVVEEMEFQKKLREKQEGDAALKHRIAFMRAKLEPLDATKLSALRGKFEAARDLHQHYAQAGLDGDALFWGMVAIENAGFQALSKANADRQRFQEAKLMLGTFLAGLKGAQNHQRARFWLESLADEGFSLSSQAKSVLQSMPIDGKDAASEIESAPPRFVDGTPQVIDGRDWRVYWESVTK